MTILGGDLNSCRLIRIWLPSFYLDPGRLFSFRWLGFLSRFLLCQESHFILLVAFYIHRFVYITLTVYFGRVFGGDGVKRRLSLFFWVFNVRVKFFDCNTRWKLFQHVLSFRRVHLERCSLSTFWRGKYLFKFRDRSKLNKRIVSYHWLVLNSLRSNCLFWTFR